MSEPRTATADKQAITQALNLYCRAMDRMDIPLGYSIWHEDGEADYGEDIYRGSGKGFVEFAAQSHAGMIAHSHQVTSIIIHLGGDVAASESYVTAVLRFAVGDQLREITTRGRYLDRWSWQDDRWAIDKRVYIHDLDDVRDIQPTGIPSRSARNTSDLSYSILKSQP
jgi:hypothetical protein